MESQLRENTWVTSMEQFTSENVNYQILEPKENLENHFPNGFLGNMSSVRYDQVLQGQMSFKSAILTGFFRQDPMTPLTCIYTWCTSKCRAVMGSPSLTIGTRFGKYCLEIISWLSSLHKWRQWSKVTCLRSHSQSLAETGAGLTSSHFESTVFQLRLLCNPGILKYAFLGDCPCCHEIDCIIT